MELLRKKNFYQTLTIFIWLSFLFIIEATGKLQVYINKKFFPFTVLGSLILLVLFIVKLKKIRKEHSENIDLISLLSFLLFLFPVLLATIVRPGNLPALAAGKRGISQEFTGADVMTILKEQLEMEGNYKKMNIKQLLAFSKNKPTEIDGKEVSVEGFVFKQNNGKEGFMLVRFLITCCAADATPLGVQVTYQNAEQLKQDEWVKVYGKCLMKENKIVILAEEVRKTQAPSNVYLY